MRDLGVENVAISGTSLTAGVLFGASLQAKIIGCYATGSIAVNSEEGAVGGLVGQSLDDPDGIITRSHANVSVSAPASSYVGGLVGLSAFTISLSYATGRVKGGANVGAGGLIGAGEGNISKSYATGSVTAGENSQVGGVIGNGGITIDNSYATGAVKGGTNSQIGGFAGALKSGSVSSSYSTGRVKGKKAGGFSGSGAGGLSPDYWDIDTSGKGKGAGCGGGGCGRGVKGLTTEEFQSGLPDGFDPNIWGEKKSINDGLPYLLALPPK